jgi:undecaprenyl pyrophosphate phosphatase UppP
LLLLMRPERVRPVLLAVALLPPAAVGFALERRIEQRLGTPATLAAGLLGGGLALVLADRALATRDDRGARLRDALALGLAQATALIPGVSRNGATLAAGRALGFSRPGASRLSWEVGLPVMAGATLLKGTRVRRRGATHARPLAIGAGAAFASTLAAVRWIGIERRRPLWPWALWRALLAAAILAVRTIARDDCPRGQATSTPWPASTRARQTARSARSSPFCARSTPVFARARCRCPGITPRCWRWRRTWASPSARTAWAPS